MKKFTLLASIFIFSVWSTKCPYIPEAYTDILKKQLSSLSPDDKAKVAKLIEDCVKLGKEYQRADAPGHKDSSGQPKGVIKAQKKEAQLKEKNSQLLTLAEDADAAAEQAYIEVLSDALFKPNIVAKVAAVIKGWIGAAEHYRDAVDATGEECEKYEKAGDDATNDTSAFDALDSQSQQKAKDIDKLGEDAYIKKLTELLAALK